MGHRLAATAAAAVALGLGACPPARAATPKLFPSDRLTVGDPAQLTGRRVALPKPDCGARPSDCHEIELIDQLDGFDLDPRIEVRFGRPIDVGKVGADTLYVERADGAGGHIRVNRLVWSPARNALYGAPASLLEESTTYRLVVSPALSGTGASTVFTTMSASAGLQQMRRALDDGSAYDAAGIAPVSRGLHVAQVFPAAEVLRIRRLEDRGPGDLVSEDVINAAVQSAGQYAFGSFESPSWLTADRVIPQPPTKDGQPAVQGSETVGFTLIVPSGSKPADGWPVAIFGPGITRSKYDLFLAADLNASRGLATMSIDPVGHAYGPRSQTEVTTPAGAVTFSGFGRGRDLNGDGKIGDSEGVQAPVQPHPLAAVALRDGLRQTALDNMALVRAIARGADIDGDGSIDLRRDGVTYYAQSLGGIYGTMLMASDPLVKAGVLNVPGGPISEIARLSPGFRALVGAELKNRRPALANGGRDGFTESTPLWADPPVTAPAQGAVAIQEAGARDNWIDRPGSPEAFAPLLVRRPVADVGAKKVIYQFAFGDQTVPNPTSATIMRAGALQKLTTIYRNDRTPTSSSNPHGFLLDPRLAGRNLGQRQALDFLASGGETITDPDGGANVFEVPIADPAEIEKLNYELPPAKGEPPPEQPAGAQPPARRTRLRITVRPRVVPAGRPVRLRIRLTAGGRAAPGVRVRVGGRVSRPTDRRGVTVLRVRFARPGRIRLTFTRRGARPARTTLTVRRG
jgi:hypothetical protein